MDHCIDLYSRLIIATITFVGPMIILLLSTFGEGEKRRIELAKATLEELTKQATEALQTEPDKFKDTINKTSEEYKKVDKKTKAELARLSPKVQFWCIYGTLALAFLLLTIDYLVRDNLFNFYDHDLSIILLIFSIISYVVSLFFIVRVFYTIINTKKLIDK